MENCKICKKQAKNSDFSYQDEFCYIQPWLQRPEDNNNYIGYYMVESRRHFKGMYNATDAEIQKIWLAIKYLSQSMKEVLGAEHVYAFVIGEGVDHFHVHVVARYPDAPKEYWGPKVDEWPYAPRGGHHQIVEWDNKIRERFLELYQN